MPDDPALVELMARALADACPTPDQCADTHDECVRQHGVHWLAVGPGGIGPQHITSIEGSPTAIARIMASALTAAGYQVLPPGGEPRTEWGIWWHADDPDGIVLSEEMIGRRERAEARAKERIGDYGITGYTIVRSEHRVWPDGTTLIGPWQPDTED